MRIVFMGTPAFALPTLKALLSAGHTIAAVYSQPPRPAGRGQKETLSPVHDFAATYKIPVFTPESLKTPESQAEFASHKADAAVIVAYGLLLPQPILDAYPLGCINVHPSLLPRWRGAAPIQRTLMAGDRTTGICIMQMDAGLDTGDILLQKTIPIEDDYDAGTLHNLLSEAAGPMVLQALEGLKAGTITPQKQSEDGVTYAKKILKDECRIDWKQSAEEVLNQIKGLAPVPGAYFMFGDEAIKIFKAVIRPGNVSVGMVADSQLGIACGSGILQPLVVQRPNKTRMSVHEMLKGRAIPPGSVVE